ncbi:MAG: haloalkane dehalogenase [Myxococcaceae bacterium]|nr:haloalkane dehalogenase [Myxococcaceae bacterium]
MSLGAVLIVGSSGGCGDVSVHERGSVDDAVVVARKAAPADAVVIEDVPLGELTFRVRSQGPEGGQLVILLHGFPETSYEWRHQIPALARAGYRVLAPDLRGYSAGARPDAISEYGLLAFVGDVLALADHAGAARFHLIGHDVGALVAWATAQLAPWRIRSLGALSVPHPGAFAAMLSDPSSCQSRASAWYRELTPPDAAGKLLQPGSRVRNIWSELDADAAREYERSLGTPEALDGALNAWRANFVDGQPQGALPIPILAPTLYIWGARDPYNCGDGEEMTRELVWSSYRFEQLPDVDHWIPERAAERLNALLLAHLREH